MPINVNTPIPSTPEEGTGVFCYQFEIPDTLLWHRTAYVMVAMLTRGRFWDKETGQITDVQQLGYDVLASLQPCSEQPPIPPPTIEEIIKIIENKECVMINNCCCGGQGDITTNTPLDEETTIPQDLDSPPDQPATTIPIDAEFLAWKCRSAKYMIDAIILALRDGGDLVAIGQANTMETESIVFERFGKIKGGNPYVVVLNTLWIFTLWLIRWGSPSLIEGMVRRIQDKADQLIQAVYCADDAQEASDIWYADLVTMEPNIFYKAWGHVGVSMVPFEAFFQDSVTRMTAPGYEEITSTYVDDCVCETAPEDIGLPANRILVPMIPDIVANINGGTISYLEELWEIMGQGNAYVDITLEEPLYQNVPVPNANRVGFYFIQVSSSVPNGNSTSQRLANASTQFTLVNFGGGGNTFLDGEVFAGAIDTDAAMQTWLVDNTFRWEDPNCVTDDGKLVTSWGIFGGTTSTGEFNEFILRAYWIIDTTGL